MKIILLNAPGGSHYDGPMMGVPALVGQLRKRGYTDIRQRDLDLELFYHALSPEMLEQAVRIIREGRCAMPPETRLSKRLFVRFFGALALKILASGVLRRKTFIESFRSATPLDRQFPEKGLLRYKKGVNRVLKLMAIYFYPFLAYPRFFSLPEKKRFQRIHLKIGFALAHCCGHGKKALEAFFESDLIPHLKKEHHDLIGISVSFKRQLEPALLLSEVIRRHGIEAKIVLGGSYITTTKDSGWLDEQLLEVADFLICCEGEEALPALLDRLKEGKSLSDVPNLVHILEGEQVANKRESIEDLDSLEPPDYQGLPLDLYLERPIRLPLMTCRGCYWGKCTYCSHHWTLGSGRLRARSPEKLFEDIHAFKKAYGVNSIYFTDESIHPPTMEALARKLLDEGTDTHWVGMLRFDECVDLDSLRLMRRSGCHAIMFGLESVSEHVQKIINKGIDLVRARRILEHCLEVGIKVHLFIILGIPGERDEDMKANIDFLLANTHLYETVQLAPFQLMVGSPMYRHPGKYGIEMIRTVSHPGQKAFSNICFESSEGLSRAQTEGYVTAITKNKILFKKDLWEGYGYRIYRRDAGSLGGTGRAGSKYASGSP